LCYDFSDGDEVSSDGDEVSSDGDEVSSDGGERVNFSVME